MIRPLLCPLIVALPSPYPAPSRPHHGAHTVRAAGTVAAANPIHPRAAATRGCEEGDGDGASDADGGGGGGGDGDRRRWGRRFRQRHTLSVP